MSIATKRGDGGMTDLMFGRRVSKTDPRVEAYGSLDELNAALGLGRAWSAKPWVQEEIARIQEELLLLMGELATLEQDRQRYLEKGKTVVTEAMVARLDEAVQALERDHGIRFSHWAMPGAAGKPGAAGLDLARTIARRAERQSVALLETQSIRNPEVIRYLNRLSDLIWLLARCEELA